VRRVLELALPRLKIEVDDAQRPVLLWMERKG